MWGKSLNYYPTSMYACPSTHVKRPLCAIRKDSRFLLGRSQEYYFQYVGGNEYEQMENYEEGKMGDTLCSLGLFPRHGWLVCLAVEADEQEEVASEQECAKRSSNFFACAFVIVG